MLAKEQKMFVSLCVTVQNLPLCLVNSLLVYAPITAKHRILCSVPTALSTVRILFASEIDTLISFFEGTLLDD